MNELLSACLHFCRSFHDGADASRLSALGLAFSRQSGLLFQLLGSLKHHQQGTHLAQLLLRIDYNRFFSKHGHDIGTIA